MDIDIFHASLAFDVTTPVKFTLASLPDGRLLRIVPSATTKKIATIHAGGSSIA